ncbi:hypothetical protein [Streptomyces sp. NPDC005486]|uniref:hypothetical protein n=1 Tax=Streptomyces sp. NPDC005486 TaxID=3155345 RepID=UPI0033A7345C
MRSLPLPLALTARLTPVAVLACAGWALSSGPLTETQDTAAKDTQKTQSEKSSGPSSTAVSKTYSAAPAPCTSVATKTVTALVPGAKTAGKEIPSTDTALRRTCSWNALKGYDYRWLDVSFEITESDETAQSSYKERIGEKSGGGAVPGLGDAAYSVVNLTTQDKQQTREGVVIAQVSNALVIVNYNGSDFETRGSANSGVGPRARRAAPVRL